MSSDFFCGGIWNSFVLLDYIVVTQWDSVVTVVNSIKLLSSEVLSPLHLRKRNKTAEENSIFTVYRHP